MEALFVLIPIAIGVMIILVIAFLYSVKSGQYDDLDGPAHRILMDDDDPLIPGRRPQQQSQQQNAQAEQSGAINPANVETQKQTGKKVSDE